MKLNVVQCGVVCYCCMMKCGVERFCSVVTVLLSVLPSVKFLILILHLANSRHQVASFNLHNLQNVENTGVVSLTYPNRFRKKK